MAAGEAVLRGRDAPLAALRVQLDAALAGRGQVALVSGEAGIGKSALAAAIAREAEARGALVTWGRAWEFADAPPYFPVWPCLRALGITTFGGDAHDEAHAFHFWENVVSTLARASSTTAMVSILEDLHAADLGTLDLLMFLAQPLRAMRVLVVATARAKDPRLTDALQCGSRGWRGTGDVRLEPLSRDDIRAVTEEAVGRAVPPALLARVVELTGGNPLFVIECARAFGAAGGVEGTLSSLPPTIRQVVLERVNLLPESTRQARPGHFVFSHTLVRDAIDDALTSEPGARIASA
jgi:hypothetical protein